MRLTRISASQVSNYDRCARYWHFNSVKKIRFPQTPAQERGSGVHKGTEIVLKTGKIDPDNNYAPYIEALRKHLPIGEKRILIEHYFELKLDGVLWIGYIDLLEAHLDPIRVMDYKTISDFRYCKTPAELAENIQLMSYGKWVYENDHTGLLRLAHLYVKTAKKVPKNPKTKLVETEVCQAQIDDFWHGKILPIVDQMKIDAQEEDTQKLPPTTSACSLYGGCPYRPHCHIEVSTPLGINRFGESTEERKTPMSSFLNRIKAAKGSKPEPETKTEPETKPEPETKAKAEVPEGVIPPDAAPRETPVEAQSAPEPEPEVKTKTRKPRKTKKTNGTSTGFTLYVDCMPVKDVDDDLEPTLFEDWVSPIIMKLNDQAKEEKNLPHFMLLSYGDQKAAFMTSVEANVNGSMPKTMVLNSHTPWARDAMGILIPHASRVVRAL